MRKWVLKLYMLAIATLLVGAVSSCTESNTTAPDLGFIHINPRTIEVVIPYADFVDELQVFGGYGSAADFDRGIVSLDQNDFEVRSIMSMDDVPTSVLVGGIFDSDLSFVGGRVVLAFDTVSGTLNFPVDVEVFDVREEWHGPSVTWDATVDTVGIAACLLGRHVSRRAHDRANAGGRGCFRRVVNSGTHNRIRRIRARLQPFGDTPIQNENFSKITHHDVPWFEVAVNNIMGMRKSHRVADFHKHAE